MIRRDAIACRAGIGLRLAHLAEVVTTRPAAAWLEIHPENFLANPHARELLREARTHYPVSVHTVGVSVGSASGLDPEHLVRIRDLVAELEPMLVSGHLAWSTHEGAYLNDLLPLPYDGETLALVARHVDEVQEALGRRYLIENPSSYLGFTGSTMTEPEFLAELVRRTGCGLLCDVSNIHLSAHNLGYDARAYIDALPRAAIGEMHLGGFVAEEEAAGGVVLVDTHSRPIAEAAWDLYAYALRRLGARPTLIEWDNEIPAIADLVAQARRADEIAAGVARGEHADALAG